MVQHRERASENRSLGLDIWRIALYLTDALEDSLAAKLIGAIRNRNVPAICRVCDESFQPSKLSLRECYVILQIKALFSKNEEHTAANFRDVALESFNQDESRNSETNARLHYFRYHRLLEDAWFREKLSKAFHLLDECLGPFEVFLESVPDLLKLTSGATSSLPRSRSMRYRKVRRVVRGSARLEPLIQALRRTVRTKFVLKDEEANLLQVVRKNYKTGRTIACEPDGALPFQLAFDRYAKKRLLRKGQDLSNQRRNSEAARVSSITGEFATVDFESASNSVTTGLIDLMSTHSPNLSRYCDYLYRCRSSSYRLVRGGEIAGRYHMFSSMGNGATFSLETLLFWALGKSVGSREIQVYGDDVVIESHLVEDYKRLTAFVGFRFNDSKTFTSGPFRESCGGNYFRGVDITPVYIRKRLSKPLTCHVINLFAQRMEFLPARLRSYFFNFVSRARLPTAPPTLPSWAGVWASEDVLLRKGLVRRTLTGEYTTAALTGHVVQRQVRDIRTYILWLIDRATSMEPPIFEDPLLESLQKGSRHVKWTLRKQPALVGKASAGWKGHSFLI